MLFYLLFLIAVFVFGSYTIGPFSIRVYMTVLMFLFLLLLSKNNPKLRVDKYVGLFIIYIILLYIAMVMNGEASDFGIIQWILAFHLVCIIIYYATKFFVGVDSEKRLSVVIMAMALLTLVDSAVTIAQYYNSSLAWGLNMLITEGRNEEVASFVNESISSADSLLGSAKTPGVFGSVVSNAIFLSTFGIFPFALINHEKIWQSVMAYAAIGFSLFACFACQERAAFLVLFAGILFILYRLSKRKWSFVLIVSICLLLVFFFFLGNNSGYDLGRFQDLSIRGDTRGDIWVQFGPFFEENWLWGGPMKFRQMADRLPHNFFLSAFVFGGLFGGLTVIVLFIAITARCINNVLRKSNSIITLVFSLSLLCFLAQGMVHNSSLVTGDVEIFFLLALMIVSERLRQVQTVS